MINITAKCYLIDFYMNFQGNFPLQPRAGDGAVEKGGREAMEGMKGSGGMKGSECKEGRDGRWRSRREGGRGGEGRK